MATIQRECCDYCMWLGPVNKDGTMRKHRPAREGTVSGERKVQDFTKPACDGSNKPYARFGCESEEPSETPETNDAPEPCGQKMFKLSGGVAYCNKPKGHDKAHMVNPTQGLGPSLDDYAAASRIVQSLIPGVRR